jgi:hypothetical protein
MGKFFSCTSHRNEETKTFPSSSLFSKHGGEVAGNDLQQTFKFIEQTRLVIGEARYMWHDLFCYFQISPARLNASYKE